MVDADGVVLEVPDDTRLDVHVDAITEEMCVERSGKRWSCVPLETRSSYSPIWAQEAFLTTGGHCASRHA